MSGAERNGSIEHMKERKEDARVGGRQGGEGREGMGGVGEHEGITFRVSGVEQLLASMDNPQAIPK